MVRIRKADQRGLASFGWLTSRHTFSFGEYYDPEHMGFGVLRVINDDQVAPGGGFPPHPHQDMEIISWVLAGALEHRDSLGNGSVIRPGDFQRMSAGTGIRHSEYNASRTEPVHFLQIWIIPDARGIAPGYEQRHIDLDAARGRLALIASPDGADASVRLHQDVRIHAGRFDADPPAGCDLAPGRAAWVQVARGRIRVNGEALSAGDGIALSNTSQVLLDEADNAEVLLFDLPAPA